MIIRFWHHKPFPTEFRSKFELPEWPYFNSEYGPMPEVLTRFCQELGIVRIEIEKKAHKLFAPLDFHDPLLKERGQWAYDWEPWTGYCTSGNFDGNTLTIRAWNPNAPKFKQRVVSAGAPDNYAWYYWNTTVRVLAMDNEAVKYGELTQKTSKQPREGTSQEVKGFDPTGKWID
jgi:hypothetical protein